LATNGAGKLSGACGGSDQGDPVIDAAWPQRYGGGSYQTCVFYLSSDCESLPEKLDFTSNLGVQYNYLRLAARAFWLRPGRYRTSREGV
jgi:hypothetical protein